MAAIVPWNDGVAACTPQLIEPSARARPTAAMATRRRMRISFRATGQIPREVLGPPPGRRRCTRRARAETAWLLRLARVERVRIGSPEGPAREGGRPGATNVDGTAATTWERSSMSDEPQLSFDEDIKPLFRDVDRTEMEWAFDLWNEADVRSNADAILERLEARDMPCDDVWPAEKIEIFKHWMNQAA